MLKILNNEVHEHSD